MQTPDSLYGAYHSLDLPGQTGWCKNTFEAYSIVNDLNTPFDAFSREGVEILSQKRNIVARVSTGAGIFWLKGFRPRSSFSWLRYLGRESKARKAWGNAFRLLSNNVLTPRPLLYMQRTGFLGKPHAFIVFEDFCDSSPFPFWLHQENDQSRARLLKVVGRYLRRFHDAGFRHRDLQGSNLLVRLGDEENWECALIDINRARYHPHLKPAQCLRDLERLSLEDEDLDVFFDSYGNTPNEALSMCDRFRRTRRFRARLQNLPWPLNRLTRRLWYYWREIRTFSRSQSL